MKRALPLLLLLVAELLTAPLAATTYVMTPDGALAEQAEIIGRFRVAERRNADEAGFATEHRLEPLELLKGGVEGPIWVRTLGGEREDGSGLHVFASPHLDPGSRVLLFLRPRAQGNWAIVHMILGAFDEIEHLGRRFYTRPHLGEGQELPSGRELYHRPRDADRFDSWLRQRDRGERPPSDYFVGPTEVDPGALTERFTLIRDDVTDLPFRWFDFDGGGSVRWFAHQDGEPAFAGGGFAEFEQALQAWNSVGNTTVRYRYLGTTGASAGFQRADGVNAILFGDPNNDIEDVFSCADGGVLAVGGPFFNRNFRGFFGGNEYLVIGEADVITNNGISCSLRNDSSRAAELYTHEIGHTLGVGHSCGDDESPPCNALRSQATMRATIHYDGRGASLRADDRAAAQMLYGSGVPSPPDAPIAPSALSAEQVRNTIVLSWQDDSNNETGFRVTRRNDSVPGGTFVNLATTAANTTGFVDANVVVGNAYAYEVRAVNQGVLSPPSNRVLVIVTQPASGGAHFSMDAYQAPESGSQIELRIHRVGGDFGALSYQVTTSDLSADEGNDYLPLQTTISWGDGDSSDRVLPFFPLNDTEAEGSELARVAAVLTQGGDGSPENARAEAAVVIVDDDRDPGCAGPPAEICLLDDRFRVEVFWRNQRNERRGDGTARTETAQSGLFWFFNADNVELITKMIDGTSSSGAFWFFYGALTDVEFWMTVTDTADGTVRTYYNPPGNVCGLGDVLAFPQPGTGLVAPAAAHSRAVAAHSRAVAAHSRAVAAHSRAAEGLPAPLHAIDLGSASPAQSQLSPRQGACLAGAQTLCLLDGRFEISVEWENQRNGLSGVGTVVEDSDQTGFFWFFNRRNLELVVKMIDGESANDHFWVFYGSLTDVGFTLHVRDTVAETTRDFVNQPGNICGDAEIQAFPAP